MKKILIWLFIICSVLVFLEIGITIKLKRKLQKNFTVITDTSFGAPLSRRPGNVRFMTDPYTIFRIKPNQRYGNCTINGWGFRCRNFKEKKEENIFRIIITGGSAAFGITMYDDKKMFDRILEENLNASSNRKYEVINAGIPGFNSAMELSLFVHQLSHLDPDMIINLTGWNDFYIPHFNPGNNPATHNAYTEFESLMVKGPLRALADKSNAFMVFDREFKRILDQFGLKKKNGSSQWQYLQTSVDYFKQNMINIATQCKGMGIAHIIALQPEECQRANHCDREMQDLKAHGEQYIDAIVKTYAGFREATNEVAEQFPDTQFIDLTPVFDRVEGCIWNDFVHFNETGHRIVADVLANEILSH